MSDWIDRLDTVIQMNGRELLEHAGKISHEMALEKSGKEYEKYRIGIRAAEHEQSLKELESDIKELEKDIKN